MKAQARLLIVDDDHDAREAICRFLSKKIDGVIEGSADGADALEKIKREDFDLVFLDIKMPGLSGFDVLKNIAAAKPRTKFVVVSAYDSKEVADKALACGASDFMPKPQTQEALVMKAEEVLAQMGKFYPKGA